MKTGMASHQELEERRKAARVYLNMITADQHPEIIYTRIEQRGRGGSTAHVSLYVVCDNRIECITQSAASVLGRKVTKHGLIIVHGGGIDHGQHLFMCLARKMNWDKKVISHVKL